MAAAYNNLGTLLQTLGDREQAISALRSAVRLDERLVDAHLNLALALQQQGDLLAAADYYRRAIALRPDVASAHYNLGLVRQGLRDWSAADACYHEALRLDPKYVEPRVALGINRQAVGEDDAAMQWFDSALAIDAEAAEAHCNRGMLLLARGRFAEGWPEYRWIARCKPGRPLGAQPVWDGAPLAGKRVLVRSNQGTGDLLQYMRYLSCIRRRGAGTVYLAAPAPLHPLLAGSGVSKLVTEDTLPPYDVQSSIMLLPALFFDEAGWMADRVPYVRAARVRVAEWHQWLAGYQGFRVGICWQGNPEFAWDGWRSAPLSAFLPIADTPGVKLFSLQRGYGSEQLDQLARRRGIVELPAEFDGPQGAFMDTAAVLENLDLVITTDTAMAHLAGAMGVRTWVALSFAPEWRWQRQGEASPWYPTMKLFRQTTRGDWASVFDRMSEELRGIVG
jgi:lipoprotein NlpI